MREGTALETRKSHPCQHFLVCVEGRKGGWDAFSEHTLTDHQLRNSLRS